MIEIRVIIQENKDGLFSIHADTKSHGENTLNLKMMGSVVWREVDAIVRKIIKASKIEAVVEGYGQGATDAAEATARRAGFNFPK